MVKKIYMPDIDKLHMIQEMDANIYKYLLSKAIEAIVIEGIKYPKKGMLKNNYKYIKEDEDIARAICYMFPNELAYSEVASYDSRLCLALLTQEKDETITSLDNLSQFCYSVNDNYQVIISTIKLLSEKIKSNPTYRFTYEFSTLLNNIFSGKLDCHILPNESIKQLGTIEPAYILSLSQRLSSQEMAELMEQSIETYAQRYLISQNSGTEYKKRDILNNPDIKVRRLIKTINQNEDNIY